MKYENTAVIVVDMQNSFAYEDGSLYAPPSENVIGDIEEFVQEMRTRGSPIIFTKDTHTDEQFEDLDHYDEFERWGEHAVRGTFEHEIVDGLTVTENDRVIEKSTYDAFHNTSLEGELTNRGVENVIVVGTLANVCVLHTASSAALNDYNTIVVEDLVGYIEESDKEYALEHVDWLFGTVLSTDQVRERLE
jgi:nicotinamidase-related amidase